MQNNLSLEDRAARLSFQGEGTWLSALFLAGILEGNYLDPRAAYLSTAGTIPLYMFTFRIGSEKILDQVQQEFHDCSPNEARNLAWYAQHTKGMARGAAYGIGVFLGIALKAFEVIDSTHFLQ